MHIAKKYFYAIDIDTIAQLRWAMPNKLFSERLNRELDNIGVPPRNEERVEAFAKLIKLPKFKAEAFLNGAVLPDNQLLALIAEELEVNADWLVGKSEQKQKKTKA
jgi:hypothetical protein